MPEVINKTFDLRGRRLMIAIPAYDGKLNIASAFQLPQVAMQVQRLGVELQLAHISGCSIITRARNALVHRFMQSDCTDLLFVDADINFTHKDVMRVMALASDKDVVAGAYPRRSADKMFFADIFYNEHGGVEIVDGLLQVLRIGTGFMLIRRHVIEKLIADHPEWKYYVNVEKTHHYSVFDFSSTAEGYMGEDYLFCNRVYDAGFKVYIDPDTNLGHFGQEEFTAHFGKQVLDRMIEDVMQDEKAA